MSESEAPGGDPSSKLILFVDDDPGFLDLLGMLCTKAGFKTLTAATGEAGIEQLARKPDLIVLDLVMPGCGGLGVLSYLQAGGVDPLPPVIVLTAHDNRHPDVQKALMDPNVTQCLTKPVNDEKLLGVLYRYTNTAPRKK
jgi:CheY-like chemotaxis protein